MKMTKDQAALARALKRIGHLEELCKERARLIEKIQLEKEDLEDMLAAERAEKETLEDELSALRTGRTL